EVRDRLGEIRLPLAVAADEHVRAGLERELGLRIVAEVLQAQVLDDHEWNLVGRSDNVLPRRWAVLRERMPPDPLRGSSRQSQRAPEVRGSARRECNVRSGDGEQRPLR